MLEKIGTNRYRIPQSGKMNVEPVIYLNGQLLKQLEEQAIKQFSDAASLPGVIAVIGMPDVHTGFGIPIGGVMVMDGEEGLISAGAVGMDINCGVRLLSTPLNISDVDRRDMGRLARMIANDVPTGIGTTSPHKKELQHSLDEIFINGVKALVEPGFTKKDDLKHIQDGGCYPGAKLNAITPDSRRRADQLSTLGGGNHFIEIDRATEIFDKKTADSYGITAGQILIQVHTGSRGFGHQTCVDYSKLMNQEADEMGLEIPTKGLAAVPIQSETGQDYLAAMAAAANFAYANRQVLTHDIRNVFNRFASTRFGKEQVETIYDISHNLARFEEYDEKKLLIHRKGAVRALPGEHPDCPENFSSSGPPVLVPGNMGSSSYVLKATSLAHETYYSVNHGAGRTMSRTQAKKEITSENLKEVMGKIPIYGVKKEKVLDEAPQAYKNIGEVVETLTDIGITKKVARLEPLAVIKGN